MESQLILALTQIFPLALFAFYLGVNYVRHCPSQFLPKPLLVSFFLLWIQTIGAAVALATVTTEYAHVLVMQDKCHLRPVIVAWWFMAFNSWLLTAMAIAVDDVRNGKASVATGWLCRLLNDIEHKTGLYPEFALPQLFLCLATATLLLWACFQ